MKKSGSKDYPNNADGSNTASRVIAWELVSLIDCKPYLWKYLWTNCRKLI
jgi:hypothetical protein